MIKALFIQPTLDMLILILRIPDSEIFGMTTSLTYNNKLNGLFMSDNKQKCSILVYNSVFVIYKLQFRNRNSVDL